jgi:hypothetical protein
MTLWRLDRGGLAWLVALGVGARDIALEAVALPTVMERPLCERLAQLNSSMRGKTDLGVVLLREW